MINGFPENKIYTRYVIEIVNDAKTWDKFCKVVESPVGKYGVEPWELYTVKDFDSLEDALTYYMVWYVSENCYDIKMWECVCKGEEVLSEEYVEPASTTKWNMRNNIDREMNSRMMNAEREMRELEKSNKLMDGFIKVLGNQYTEMFKEYCEREEKRNEK